MSETNAVILDSRNQQIARQEPTVLEVIRELAVDERVSVEKLAGLMQLQERAEARSAEREFNQAMTRLQAKLPRIVRRRKIEIKGTLRSKYAAMEDIDEVVRPLMIEEGFSASYTTEDHGPKETKITCTIRHQMGHKEHYSVIMPYDRSEFRSDVQCQGSTISFGMRRAFCLGMNIVTVGEDNDGQGDFISEQQADSILDMINACSTPADPFESVKSRFLRWIDAKVVSEIHARDYQKCMAKLQEKARGAK